MDHGPRTSCVAVVVQFDIEGFALLAADEVPGRHIVRVDQITIIDRLEATPYHDLGIGLLVADAKQLAA